MKRTHADVSDLQTRVEVRATINLPGLKAGSVVWVDPEDEYVQTCLEAEYLVPIKDE